jgi:glycosyltransferase involved in cell wall biosynthesis
LSRVSRIEESRTADEPLRVLQIYPKGDFHTGAAIQLRDLARGLAARGHRVLVVTRPSERWAREAAEAGFRHHGVFRSPADPFGAVRLGRLIRTGEIQLVHAHKGGGRTLTLFARLFGPRPPLVVNRGVTFRLSLGGRLVDTGSRVAAVVAVCEAIKRDLVAQGMPPGKVEVVYSGTDTHRFDPERVTGDPTRRELGLPAGAPLVTQVGVRETKGNDDVLRAFARIRAARPDARLLLVGARPEKRPPLATLTAALGLAGAVTVWPYRDDVPEILAATDVSVDGSHVGHGITGALRESLAMETPVVATDAAGNPELVLPERTGLLVPPRDPAALAAAVLRLLGDPALAQALGRAGRRWVRERFSTEAKVQRLEGLYRRLAARPT